MNKLFLLLALITLASPTFAQQQNAATQEVVLMGDEDAGPTILFDDEEISKKELTALDPASIGSIQILKAEEAEQKFGKYGEFGAIVVTSKGKSQTTTEESPGMAPAEAGDTAPSGPSFDMPEDAYIVIDGKMSTMADLRALLPENIDQVQVHKTAQATELFGQKAKAGAVVVVTKQ